MTTLILVVAGAVLGALVHSFACRGPEVDVAVLRAYQEQRRRVLYLERKLAERAP